jgi:ergothioneine biosynthesis protein EgtB
MRRLNRRALHDALLNARQYTNALLGDLSDAQWRVPYLRIINPPLWELGHVGWFMEHWCLRWQGQGEPKAPSLLEHADRWYDSSAVAHDTRWTLDLPDRAATEDYVDAVLDRTLEKLERTADDDDALYFFRLALYHEDMHCEAFAYTRQTLGYPVAQRLPGPTGDVTGGGRDIELAGGAFEQGAPRVRGFVFDNEKWAHEVRIAPFAIADAPVTNRAFCAFVEDDGYACAELWSDEGRAWLAQSGQTAPRYWRRAENGRGDWQERKFDRWRALAPNEPVRHVNAFEAEAYCRWAGRRLPTESEWEYAAASGAIAPQGVWEWTVTPFAPYPGFSADPYADYSQPWFHTHRVVRGASFATPARLHHPRFRNFYTPERADLFVGFRTAAA